MIGCGMLTLGALVLVLAFTLLTIIVVLEWLAE